MLGKRQIAWTTTAFILASLTVPAGNLASCQEDAPVVSAQTTVGLDAFPLDRIISMIAGKQPADVSKQQWERDWKRVREEMARFEIVITDEFTTTMGELAGFASAEPPSVQTRLRALEETDEKRTVKPELGATKSLKPRVVVTDLTAKGRKEVTLEIEWEAKPGHGVGLSPNLMAVRYCFPVRVPLSVERFEVVGQRTSSSASE